MQRRDFLGAAGAALGGLGLAAGPARADEAARWKMVTSWPKNFPGLGTGAETLARYIGEMSGGRLTVQVYGAGELVPAFEVFDAVEQGVAQMGHSAAYYWKGKSPTFQFFSTLPFGMTAGEMSGWLYKGGGLELWEEAYRPFGLVPMPVGDTFVQMGGWFRRELQSVEDLQGLRMRIPGLGGEVLRRAGGTPVNIPGGELLVAMQTGNIDAAEWVGPWNDLAFGFHKVAKFYYGPGFHEPSSALEVIVDKAKFESLPADLRAAVENACMAENGYMLSEFTAANGAAQAVLTGTHGVAIGSFPEDVVRAAYAAAAEVAAETASFDDLARRVYESWSGFRAEAVARAPFAERGYMNDRARAG